MHKDGTQDLLTRKEIEEEIKVFEDFHKTWNLERIKNMTLDDYTKLGSQETLTYAIEHKLKFIELGGRSSFKFGIYQCRTAPTLATYLNSPTTSDGKYAWTLRYGKTAQEAFETIKNIIISIAEFSQLGKLNEIEAIVLNHNFKWKLAFYFQNPKNLCLFGVVAELALKNIAQNEFGDENLKTSEIYFQIFQKYGKPNSLTDLFQLTRKMWLIYQEQKALSSTEEWGDEHLQDKTSQPLNQILYGPPGTGKTFHTISKALEILEGENVDLKKALDEAQRKRLKEKFDSYIKEGNIVFVTFHQSYGYEEFVEGIKPIMSDKNDNPRYTIADGIFKSICQQAKERPKEPFILIIDEINRGNVSKIFGELITLIEPSKRLDEKEELRVKLPYSQESFGVPKNLYIIGTMNTVDRSVTALDTALRRRFDFVEMMPETGTLEKIWVADNNDGEIDYYEGEYKIKLDQILQAINERIEFLYDREKAIGHAFFLSETQYDKEEECSFIEFETLKKIFQNKIIPLLQEYFYNDYEAIQAVLNHNGMVQDKKHFNISEQFRNFVNDRGMEDKKVFEITPKDSGIWDDPQIYIDIYSKDR